MGILQVASPPVSVTALGRASVEAGGVGYVQKQPAEILSFPASPKTGASDTVDIYDAPSSEKLEQAVRQINGSFNQKGQTLYAAYEKDKITGINIIKIVDKKTNETISQMPPKEIVKFAQFIELSQEMRGQLIHSMA